MVIGHGSSVIGPAEGGVCAPQGFLAAGVACGIKTHGLDLALVTSERPCVAAGVFTTNAFQAAPVIVCKELLARGGELHGIVAHSGIANACTGAAGVDDAREISRMAGAAVARRFGPLSARMLVAETGLIGVRVPLDRVADGIEAAAARLSREGHTEAARAIMTTDTRTKEWAASLELGDRQVCVGGMAKGSGMIGPHLATMLAFITTDAALSSQAARRALEEAVADSFNCIAVDGDTSTNDSVLLLANGASESAPIEAEADPRWPGFVAALRTVCHRLAMEIVGDGEGASKRIEIRVTGAANPEDADRVTRAIALSPLVKTAVFGGDPNWGRIAVAIGASGASVDPPRTRIELGGVTVMEHGEPVPEAEEMAAEAMKDQYVVIAVDLGLGTAQRTFWTTDLTYDYVRINAEYRT